MRFLSLLLATFLLTCDTAPTDYHSESARSAVADTVPLDSLRLWEWPRQWSPQWEVVSMSPLSTRRVPGSSYTGYVSVQPGPIQGQYVHWYRWQRGDTLRIDAMVRVRCGRTTVPTFEELRVLIPVTPQLATPLDVTVTVPEATQRFLVPRGYVTRIRDPEAASPESGREIDIEYGPWIRIPTLAPCDADSLRLCVAIANLLDTATLPPRPLWLWVELRNRQAFQTVVGKMAVGVAVTEP